MKKIISLALLTSFSFFGVSAYANMTDKSEVKTEMMSEKKEMKMMMKGDYMICQENNTVAMMDKNHMMMIKNKEGVVKFYDKDKKEVTQTIDAKTKDAWMKKMDDMMKMPEKDMDKMDDKMKDEMMKMKKDIMSLETTTTK